MFKRKKLKKIEARIEIVERDIEFFETLSREVSEMKMKLFRIAKSENDEEVENQIVELEEDLHNLNCYLLGNVVRLQNECDALEHERWKLI